MAKRPFNTSQFLKSSEIGSWQHPRAGIGKQACVFKSPILEWGSTEISKAVCQDYDSLK